MKFHLLPPAERRLGIQADDLYPFIPCQCPNSPAAKTALAPEKKPTPSISFQQKFFQDALPYALATQETTGIPASVSLAQAALESGWGKHAPGNNFFGIKGKGPAGTQRLTTHEYRNGKRIRVQANFRRYHDPTESFLDHARLISEGKKLRHAMQETQSAQAFVHALQSGPYRYASDPNYEAKIMKLIRDYRLERYDLRQP